jgi:hypothetical protein
MSGSDDSDEILFNEEPPEKGQLMAARSGSRFVQNNSIISGETCILFQKL